MPHLDDLPIMTDIERANYDARQARINPSAERLLGLYFPVLDHGFVSLVDYCGGDFSIVRAARTSYQHGVRKRTDDRNIIRYLLRHDHGSPFEFVQFTFHCQLPIFVARQWIRHRTSCLSGDTMLWFDLPGAINKNKRHISKLSVKNFYDKWHSSNSFTRARIKQMCLRSLDERTNEIVFTNVTDIWSNGVKLVFKVTFDNGYSIKMTKDHLCYTDKGWLTLEQASGLHISRDNNVSWKMDSPKFATNGEPCYYSFDWMKDQRDKGLNVTQISEFAGCSYHTIRKWLKRHKLQFTPKERAKFSSATQRGVKRGRINKKPLSEDHIKKIKEARSGVRSNFWKGGVCAERHNIGRWTTENARKIHKKFDYKCVICESNYKLVAHHLDPVWNNIEKARDLDNLVTLCSSCHKHIHANNLELEFLNYATEHQSGIGFDLLPHLDWPPKKPRPQKVRVVGVFRSIKNIEMCDEEEVFDLSVNGPNHNFVANGVVVHNSVNEMSGRYSILPLMFYTPREEDLKTQSLGNKQGRDGELTKEAIQAFYAGSQQVRQYASEMYESAISDDVARELARIDLPLSTYTNWYWSVNLRSLMNFMTLRCDSHSQWEIRQYANTIAGIVQQVVPEAFEAWIDYEYCSHKLSRQELQLLPVYEQVERNETIEETAAKLGMSKREIKEFFDNISGGEKPDFTLDMAKAKTPQYFSTQAEQYIPSQGE